MILAPFLCLLTLFLPQLISSQRPERFLNVEEKEEPAHECYHDKIMRPPEISFQGPPDGTDRVLQTNAFWAYSLNNHRSLEARGETGTLWPIRIQFDFTCKAKI